MSAPVTLIGKIGVDPELRFAPSGNAVANLRVVTDRRYKDGDEWKSTDTTWWQVVAFRQLAERIVDRLAYADWAYDPDPRVVVALDRLAFEATGLARRLEAAL